MCLAAPECIFRLDNGAIKSRVSWGFPLHHLLWIRWRGVEVCVAYHIAFFLSNLFLGTIEKDNGFLIGF